MSACSFTFIYVKISSAEDSSCTLSDVCIFFSGASQPPPLGFPVKPTLRFLDKVNLFPTSSTCSLILRLPTGHSTYAQFSDAMLLGIKGNDGFGSP